ncbi:MAG: type I 3-dehydroquinate dehydratase [Rhodocyclaceae bacterium]|nr:type I 3-dehydroquinate dehydratase [Rhodocyclaceae bacterium]
MKTLSLRGGCRIAPDTPPLVCAPLTARDSAALTRQAADIIAQQPDLIEWRMDAFDALYDTGTMLEALFQLREAIDDTPILLTCRSPREGGLRRDLDETRLLDTLQVLCASGQADLLDFECRANESHFALARTLTQAAGMVLIGSSHDFDGTPDSATLRQAFARAHELGADIAKVAVMPANRGDVLRMMTATLAADTTLPIPVIGISMGELGRITRYSAAFIRSAITFAAAADASAPGQIPLAELRRIFTILPKENPDTRAFG